MTRRYYLVETERLSEATYRIKAADEEEAKRLVEAGEGVEQDGDPGTIQSTNATVDEDQDDD